MTYKTQYNLDGTFAYVAMYGTNPNFPNGFVPITPNDPDPTAWNAYVAANGVPPATSVPPHLQIANYINTSLTPTQQGQVHFALLGWILSQHPELITAINNKFGLSIPII